MVERIHVKNKVYNIQGFLCHRFTESFVLEKSSKISKSNQKPSTAKSTSKLYPQVPHLNIYYIAPGMVIPPLAGGPCSSA